MMFELAPLSTVNGEAVLPLAAAKEHLRIVIDDEDDLIAALRDAAVDFVQKFTEIQLSAQVRTWTGQFCAEGIVTGVRPITAIGSIVYRDSSGAAVTLDPALYAIGLHGRIVPMIGASWPRAAAIENAVTITFTAGFASAADIPPSLISAIKLMLGHLYRQREAVVTKGASGEVPFGVTALCDLHRLSKV